MTCIVAYGLGNVAAFENVFRKLDLPIRIARAAAELEGATRLILPGVGAFDHAMRKLEDSGMRDALDELVLGQKVPVLGVCVGMQMLAESSDEGNLSGLGYIPGRVRLFEPGAKSAVTLIPHMGWNGVASRGGSALFEGLGLEAYFYFLHSYYFECAEPDDALATTEYGITFQSAVRRGNVLGVQFHPEKSHRAGETLLRNFAEL